MSACSLFKDVLSGSGGCDRSILYVKAVVSIWSLIPILVLLGRDFQNGDEATRQCRIIFCFFLAVVA